MIILRNEYPRIEGARFDEQYFLGTHLPLASDVLGAFVRGSRVYREISTNGGAPQSLIVSEFDFDTDEDIQAAMSSPRIAELAADVAAFTDLSGVQTLLLKR